MPRTANIVIAVPTVIEAEPLKQTVDFPVRWVITGVGPAAAAHSITRDICTKGRPSGVLIAGIAGAYSHSGLEPGKICIASSESFGDLGRCSKKGIERIEIPGSDSLKIRFDLSVHVENILPRLETRLPDFSLVPMTTVSCSSGCRKRAEDIAEFTGAMVENMEGAAIVQSCLALDVPVWEIRTISNEAGESDKTKWHFDLALSRLSHAVKDFLCKCSAY